MDELARQHLIEQLKPLVNEPEFNAIFSRLTQGLTGPERFQLKRVIKELAAPCNIRVDLRKRVVGDVQTYTYRGIIHYMDPIAIRIFEDGLDRYKGIFTQDTYENILNAENNIRVLQEKEKEMALEAKLRGEEYTYGQLSEYFTGSYFKLNELEQEQAVTVPFFTFGRYIKRSEERMNYAAAITVTLGEVEYAAITTDISLSGIRVRLRETVEPIAQEVLERGQQAWVQFTGLSQEFTLGEATAGVAYIIMGADLTDKGLYIRLKRSYEETTEDFDIFLHKFISGYKFRYKINVDNTYSGLMSKAHEQLYLPRMNSVPLYFRYSDKRLYPHLALENIMNNTLLDTWLDEDNQCAVGGLFSSKRLVHLLKRLGRDKKEIVFATVYTFHVINKGKVYFYSAFDFELTDQELKRVFLGYASRRPNFRVFRAAFSHIDIGKAWLPLTLPEGTEQETSSLRPPSVEVMAQLEGLSHLCLLTDITPPAESYHRYDVERSELAVMNDFVHPKTGLSELQRSSLNLTNIRKESRYSYRTQVRVASEQQVLIGMTRDFSTEGLQVELERPLRVEKGDIVQITLIQLIKRYAQYHLKNLEYRVMHISKDMTSVHLQIAHFDKHPGKRFFSYLIDTYYSSLKSYEQTGTVHGLELCLRNLYCNTLMSFVLFFSKKRSEPFQLTLAGVSPLNEPLKIKCHELSNTERLTLLPVLTERFIKDELENIYNALDVQRAWKGTVIVQRSVEENYLRTHTMWIESTGVVEPVEDQHQIKKYIAQGLLNGEIYAMQIEVCKTGRPDTEFISGELAYLQSYAEHKAKEIEKDMWGVVGFVDALDITQEVLFRFGLESKTKKTV